MEEEYQNGDWNGRRCDTCCCWKKNIVFNNGKGFCFRFPESVVTDECHWCFEYKPDNNKQAERKKMLNDVS